jgi:hypothetical protein
MKGRLCILAVSTLLIAAVAFCACAPGEEYLPVTTEELIGNFTAYKGQNVEVTGKLVEVCEPILCPQVEYPPCKNVTVEKNLDKYYPYCWSPWGISSSGKTGEKNIVALMPSGTRYWKDFNDFERGQQIEIRGKAHVTTIEVPSCNPSCYLEIRSSLYISVRPENVKIIPQ